MMQPTEINQEVIPEYVWAWTVMCPECGKKVLVNMDESQLQERRIFLIEENENAVGYILTGPTTCQRCETPSYIKHELNEDEILICCLTQEPDRPTPMAAPEKRPTIGNHFSKN